MKTVADLERELAAREADLKRAEEALAATSRELAAAVEHEAALAVRDGGA